MPKSMNEWERTIESSKCWHARTPSKRRTLSSILKFTIQSDVYIHLQKSEHFGPLEINGQKSSNKASSFDPVNQNESSQRRDLELKQTKKLISLFYFFVVIAVCSKWITIYSWEISESKQKCVCVCDETQNCAHTLRHNDAIEYLLLFHWEKKSRIIILILIEISIWRRTRKSRQETIWGSERQLSAPPPPPLEKDHRTGQCFPIMRINKAKTIIGWKMPISRQREIAFQMELS